MRQISNTHETPSARLVGDIRRATRRQYPAEEKARIVLDGLTAARKGSPMRYIPTKPAADNVSRNKGTNSSSR